MHHALEIQEILLKIFGSCYSPRTGRWTPDLAALARTCRVFKEPALDVLWEELYDLSPLARCLPEASQQLTPDDPYEYSFSRPLTQSEWDILRSYTRRIRSIWDFQSGLYQNTLSVLSNLPTTESLFPGLRHLCCEYNTAEAMPLLHFPFPSLISFTFIVDFQNPNTSKDSLQAFPHFSPSIKRIHFRIHYCDVAFSKFVSDYICGWQNLQTVICTEIALDVGALAHLSRMPELTRLRFSLGATLPASDSPLVFSNLHHLTLRSEPWNTSPRLLSRIRLPAIADFTATIFGCPSRLELSSFFASVQTSGAGNTIEKLRLDYSWGNVYRSEPLLGLDDLRPTMGFSHLRRMELDIGWNVGLTDSDLLTLTSAWPGLEKLYINFSLGWNTPGGITPNGLLQLLQTCRSLHRIALAIDTRGYTEFSRSPQSLGLTLQRTFSIHVLNSTIEAESVPAVAAFFAGIAPCPNFSFSAWRCRKRILPPDWEVYKNRWDEVYRRAKDAVSRRS